MSIVNLEIPIWATLRVGPTAVGPYIGRNALIGQIRYKHALNRIFAHCLPRGLSCTYSRSSACLTGCVRVDSRVSVYLHRHLWVDSRVIRGYVPTSWFPIVVYQLSIDYTSKEFTTVKSSTVIHNSLLCPLRPRTNLQKKKSLHVARECVLVERFIKDYRHYYYLRIYITYYLTCYLS